MGRQRKWSLVARNPFATIRGHLGRRRKGVEGLCVSSLLGVLRSHTWLIGEEDVALLLECDSTPRCQDRRAHSLSFSFCSSFADGGSEDLADPRSPGVDPQFSHFSQGKQSFALWGSSLSTVRVSRCTSVEPNCSHNICTAQELWIHLRFSLIHLLTKGVFKHRLS